MMTRDFTTGEVAKMLQLVPRTVTKYVDNGMLQGYHLPSTIKGSEGKGHRRIPMQAIKNFVKEHNLPMPAELIDGKEAIVEAIYERMARITRLRKSHTMGNMQLEVMGYQYTELSQLVDELYERKLIDEPNRMYISKII